MVGVAQDKVRQSARLSALCARRRNEAMARFLTALVLIPAFLLSLNTAVFADAEAEKYVDEALPLMYHSCKSVVEEAAGDNAYIEKVIRALVSVSLYNRDVQISLFEISETAKTTLHDKFVALLQAGCEADNNALLAGVVDRAVSGALAGK
jgi:hypothetical protein